MGSGVTKPKTVIPQTKSISRHEFIFSSKIGEGGFSNVLSCMHIPSKTWVAIKETSISNILKLDAGLAMLASEVDILSFLGEAPFITNMLFAFYDVKNMYIVLDLHQGADLRYHIRKNHVFDERMAAYLVICISSALHYIHDKRILHRDIKPENIMFSETGVPHLTDFGVSYKHEDSGTEIVCYKSSGTRQYLPPEAFTKHNRHGIEADFWSLGIVLYEVLYFRRPYLKHCPSEMIHFQDDLYHHNVFLSSTSVDYAGKRAQLIKSPPLTVARRRSYIKSRQSLESLKEEDDLDDHEAEEEAEDEAEGVKAKRSLSSSLLVNEKIDQPLLRVTDEEKAFLDHWLFIARAVRENTHLSGKMGHLQKQAAADMVLEAEDYSPRGDSFRHKCVFYNTRQSLPQYLRPQCPRFTRAHGQVSHACVAVIEGLLDVRLWSRLGAGRNFKALRTHEWFQDLGLDWNAVVGGKVPPPFVPDTKEIADTFANRYRYHYVNNTHTKEQKQRYYARYQLPPLTLEEERMLDKFHYIAPQKKKLQSESSSFIRAPSIISVV